MESRIPHSQAANIKVFCRFRPFNAKEVQYKVEPIFRINNQQQLIIKDSKDVSFMFDQIYDMNTTQQKIYENVGKPILANILDGFNGTILAYGQTSSGKTHTMQGYDMNDKQVKGIIPRLIENLFQEIEKSPQTIEFKLKVSIFQIYMEKIRDLLDISKTDLKIRQNKQGPYVQNLTQAYIGQKLQLYKLVNLGQKNRITCATNMNQHSSRSHLIFLLTLNQFNSQTSQSKTSKLFLIDLAGSQKISKTGAQGKALEQAKKINLSLTSLGKVIKSLSQKITHIPYRDSKLTRIIKDSLGGNSKTTLIVTCSPHEMHMPQTLSSLRFGESAQKIKNKPKINRELTVQELQKMIQKLQSEIQYKDYKINSLQNYIKNTLNAQLPKLPNKMPPKLRQEQFSVTVSDLGDINSNHTQSQIYQYEDDDYYEARGQQQQLLLESIQFSRKQCNNTIHNYASVYEQQIASLQAQISTYKKNLQSELAKFYQLKKQYNNLNESLKELIQQNISYQEQIKDFEDQKIKYKQNVQGKYRSNSKLIFGQIGNLFKNGDICDICYQKIDNLICDKGTFLLDNHEKQVCTIECYDYWKQQKQVINKKMEQVINKSININNILDKKYPQQVTQSPFQNETNEKLIELQNKFDKLYHEYQDMLVLQTNWKVQCQLYQRKLKNKQEKISQLKGMLDQISEQMELMTQQYDQTMSVNTKIVKPVRGGFLFK